MRVCLYVLVATASLLAAGSAQAASPGDTWVDPRGFHQVTKNPEDCKIAPTKTLDANGDVVLRPARRCDLGAQPKEGEAK